MDSSIHSHSRLNFNGGLRAAVHGLESGSVLSSGRKRGNRACASLVFSLSRFSRVLADVVCGYSRCVRNRDAAGPLPRGPYQNEFQPFCFLERPWPRRPMSARSDAKLSYSGALLPHAASPPFCLCLCLCCCLCCCCCCCCAWAWAWACWYGVGLPLLPRAWRLPVSSRSISYLG